MRKRHFEIFQGKLRYYWRLVGANNKIMAQSEGYFNKANAYRAAHKLAKAMNIEVTNDDAILYEEDWLDEWIKKPKRKK